MSYETNVLVWEILKQEKGLKMSVFEKKDFMRTLRHYSQRSISFPEIEKYCLEITRILNKADRKGFSSRETADGLKKTGRLLWDHLLTRQIKEKLIHSDFKEIVLFFDEELLDIPWELLFDGEEFLCLRFNMGRLLRTKNTFNQPRYRSQDDKPRMLILANPTNDLESSYREGLYIKNILRKKNKLKTVDFKSTDIDTLYVKKNLCDYDIVHFAGHCEYDRKDPGNNGWVLKDGRFSVKDIVSMAETVEFPGIIFSNSCQSAAGGPDLISPDYHEMIYSVASAFLFSGVSHYIGAVRKIEDEVSFVFAREFYSQLLKNKSVGESVRLSRLELIRRYGLDSVFWAGYLLYGSPDFMLFRQPYENRPKLSSPQRKIRPSVRVASGVFAGAVLCLFLYVWLLTINPGASVLFIKSRRLFLKGRNKEVISSCLNIIGKDPGFLSAYSLLAEAYRRLGRSEEALKYYFEYALLSQKKNDRRSLASAYINIGWIFQQTGSYSRAQEFYKKAMEVARKNKDSLNEGAALRKLAVWHMDKEENDAALELLMKSSEINRTKSYSKEHRYNLACDYFDIGLVFCNKDDYKTARKFYEKSLALFRNLKLENEFSDCYFNIGETYLYEKEYEKALSFYMRGLESDRLMGNKPSMAADYNMIGELYVEIENLNEAENFFRQSEALCREINAPLELAAACYNLGIVYKKRGATGRAREYFRYAQEIYWPDNKIEYDKVKKELLSLTP